jgi:hypothetical protein
MKRIALLFVLVLTVVVMTLASCNDSGSTDNSTKVPDKYKDFYNYPDGRKSPTGTLMITNSINSPVLLFTSDVTASNYIGTVDSLNSIKVTLPEQKFYTIVAVDKKTWEEKGEQAERYSDLTYFSRTQPYSMKVSPSAMGGGGKWYINNPTNFWVSFEKSDGSGEIYAVAAPRTTRVFVPVQINTAYNYVPNFKKELKYQGNIIALVESAEYAQADTIYLTSANPTFTTDVNGVKPKGTSIKPAIYVTNNCDKSVRVYYGQNRQLSNGADAGEDYALISGASDVFTGLEAEAALSSINFASIAWQQRIYVTDTTAMEINKVYKIVLAGSSGSYTTTITTNDAETFFENN